MIEIRLFKGIINPGVYFEEFRNGEHIKGFFTKLMLVLGLSIIIALISSYAGIGTEQIHWYMDTTKNEKLEMAKVLFGIGHLVSSLLFPLVYMFFFTVMYWIFFHDIPFKKMFFVQLFSVSLLLIEKYLLYPLQLFLGIGRESSPFGLGVLTQLLTDHSFMLHFISYFSIFFIWAAMVQLISLIKLSQRSVKYCLTIVVCMNLLYILCGTVFRIIIEELRIII
ncbi:hypothetical protein [Metabacillus arenae]|uniref:Yip1 domain-containing protein n=1 Tax=Metabacillus arenae TaxID=2771434 RepID=A0A926RWP7_9BACI|nr:hypothetical protein [Metabacillus arenae]MBD1379367.1 hypothetical protein [Metabacillus arenae]